MVTILCEGNIDELLYEYPEDIPKGKTDLFAYTQEQTILTGDTILYDTIMSLQNPEDGNPYLIISDDHTFAEYHPEDYGMNLRQLHDILTHNLLTNGLWGV